MEKRNGTFRSIEIKTFTARDGIDHYLHVWGGVAITLQSSGCLAGKIYDVPFCRKFTYMWIGAAFYEQARLLFTRGA